MEEVLKSKDSVKSAFQSRKEEFLMKLDVDAEMKRIQEA